MSALEEAKKKRMRTCRKCGRFFEYMNVGYGLCPTCTIVDDITFKKVKEYIREQGTATAEEVAKALDISESTILQYLKDGRIEIPEGSPIFIKCELCGADIRYGKYCQDCVTKLKKDLKGSAVNIDLYEVGEKAGGKKAAKMHIYDKEKNKK